MAARGAAGAGGGGGNGGRGRGLGPGFGRGGFSGILLGTTEKRRPVPSPPGDAPPPAFLSTEGSLLSLSLQPDSLEQM